MPDLLARQLPSLFGPGRRQAWRRRVLRRLSAGVLLALALAVALAQRAPEPTVPVLVARGEVAAGAIVGEGDVEVEPRPRSTVPEGALDSTEAVLGRVATVGLTPGEVLTPARVLAREESAGPGRRLVTVPLLGSARSVAVGDRVDVYRPGRGEPVAEGARVVAIPTSSDDLAAVPEPTAVLALPVDAAGDVVTALGEDATTGFVLTTLSG